MRIVGGAGGDGVGFFVKRWLKSKIEYTADNEQNHFLTQDFRQSLSEMLWFTLAMHKNRCEFMPTHRPQPSRWHKIGNSPSPNVGLFFLPTLNISRDTQNCAFTRTDRDGLTENGTDLVWFTTTLAQIQKHSVAHEWRWMRSKHNGSHYSIPNFPRSTSFGGHNRFPLFFDQILVRIAWKGK